MGGIPDQSTELLVMVRQITAVAPSAQGRFNPRPPGVIREGSATEAVLLFLRSSPGLRTEAQIRWATGRSHAAVSWALLRLRQWKKVRCVQDPARNSRWLRYAAVKE